MKPFQFTNMGRKVGKPQPVGDKPQKTPLPVEILTTIQGITPGSKQEWRVAIALDRLKIPYRYQFSIGGGRSIRGGQVVDFWVYTSPKPTPVFVQGTYWHRDKVGSEDEWKQWKVQHIYAGKVMPNLLLWEKDLGSVDAAYRLLRKDLVG